MAPGLSRAVKCCLWQRHDRRDPLQVRTEKEGTLGHVFFHLLVCAIFCIASAESACAEESDPGLSRYLEFARASADWTWDHYDELEESWKERLDPDNVFGYRPPGGFLEMATIYAYLFEKEGNEIYAERAKKVLATYADYRDYYPEDALRRRADYSDGMPALPDFFTVMRYIRPFDRLKRLGCLTAAETAVCEKVIAESVEYTLRTQEWGAMNRAALRAENVAWALRALPDHVCAPRWKKIEEALAADNFGTWEIEDATIYHGVWLYALLGYADAAGRKDELFATPEMYYYAQYFLHLLCPDGMVPDFGDADWRRNWSLYLVFFEAAAAAYDDPHLKWAANRIANSFLDLDRVKRIGLAYHLLDCYRYGTDQLSAEPPRTLSEEVMDDVVGKKIVFRNGWASDSTYLLLNYRDEGDGGYLYRQYLRDTIPVEEEKMTHGHADENSLVLLMKNGSVLLHDGGYRDYMPSGPYGAYRQDYFHNRLCVRQEKIWMGQAEGESRYANKFEAVPGQSVLDFLHNAGSYRPVRTQKIDFLTFDDFDYSRTRLIDGSLGYEWDRVLVYLKDPELFVVFDILKARAEEYFTASNLWHTRKIVARGAHWYDTVYDAIGAVELPTSTHLLIHFPRTHYRLEGVESEMRHYQEEFVIHQTAAQHFEVGGRLAFVTVLVPHAAGEDPRSWIDRIESIESEPEGAGLQVTISDGDRQISIGAKCDLRMDIARDWRRPRYTYEAGRIAYGALETNGDFFLTTRQDEKLAFTIVNLTRATWGGQVLFDQAPSMFGLAFDGSPDKQGIGKVRYWRDETELE